MTKLLTFVLAASTLSAAPMLQIFAALGPTPDSPSYGAFLANLQSGILAGGLPSGDPATDPTAWSPHGAVVDPAWIAWDDGWAFTPFPAWMGAAGTGAFADESGTWLYFSALISGNGTQVALDGLTIAANPGGSSFTYSVAGFSTYGPELMGIIGSGPGATLLEAGEAADTPVDMLLIRGPGFYFDLSCSNLANASAAYCMTGLTDEERAAVGYALVRDAYIGTPFSVTYSYGAGNLSGQLSGTFDTPEPGTWTFALSGLLWMAWRRSRRAGSARIHLPVK